MLSTSHPQPVLSGTMDEQIALALLRFPHDLKKVERKKSKGCAKQKLLPDVLWIFNHVFVSNRHRSFFFVRIFLIDSDKGTDTGSSYATHQEY
jgi:hypothetical protein